MPDIILNKLNMNNGDIITKEKLDLIDTNSDVIQSKVNENSNKIGSLSTNGIAEADLATAIKNDRASLSENTQQIANKVDKITGKGLSTNDYTNAEKAQVATNTTNINNLTTKVGNIGTTKIFKGSTVFASLPTTGNTNGDYYYVTDKTTNYCWNGSAWIDIGNNFKLGDKTVTPKSTNFAEKINLFNSSEYRINTGVTATTVDSNSMAAIGTVANVCLSPIYDVVEGEKYTYNFKNGPAFFFYDKDNILRAKITNYTLSTTITVPTDVETPITQMLVQLGYSNGLTTNMLVKGDILPDRYVDPNELNIKLKDVNDLKTDVNELNTKISSTNPLAGKKLLFNGDSITDASFLTELANGLGVAPYDNKSWVYDIQKNNPTSICYGYGRSGWTVAKIGTETDNLVSQISSYPADMDYAILSGGYNDRAQGITLGTLSNSYDYNQTFDEFTFYGGLESMIVQCINKYPQAKIGYIITPKKIFNDSNENAKQVNYRQAIIDVCEKWSIPFLDLYKYSGLVGTELTTDTRTDTYFYNGDGTHPNRLAYITFISHKVETWMKSL